MAENRFTTEELEKSNDLMAELNGQLKNLNSGSTQYSKSLIKQNEHWSAVLSKMKEAANDSKKNHKGYMDMVDAVNDVKDGTMDINSLIAKQNKAIQDGKKGIADVYRQELGRLRNQNAINGALEGADKLTGGMASKAKDAYDSFKQMGPAMGALTIGLGIVVALLVTMMKQQKSIADQFGAMGVTRFGSELKSANAEFAKMGYSAEEAQTATSQLANNFGKSVPEAAAMSRDVARTAKALGLSTEQSADLFGKFTELTDLSAEQAKNLMKSTASLAEANGVAPDQVLKDVAKSTKAFSVWSKDGGENIMRAAIQARKLGLELDDVADIARGMLNFEESLNAEVEASLMLGKQLNFQKARELFLQKDLEGGMEAVLEQLGGQAEWNKLNALEQEAVAKAASTTTENMAKLLSKEKEAAKVAGDLKEQKIEDLVPENALTDLENIMLQLKALGITFANTLGPAIMSVLKPISELFSWLDKTGLLIPTIITLLGLMALKWAYNTAVLLKNTAAGVSNLLFRRNKKMALTQENMALGMNSMAEGTNTAAIGANTVAEGANTVAKTTNTTTAGIATTVEGGLATAKGVATTATTANTVATTANTGAKSRGIIPTLSAFAANAANAVANFFAGAAKGSAKTFGIGALILVPIALMAIAAMIGAISMIGSAVSGFKATGDLMSMAGGQERAIATPGGLHLMNQKDDIMAAPGLAKYVANGGGGGGGADTSRMESRQSETNAKLERVANVLEGALSGPRPALARAMGSSVGDNVSNMA